MIKIIFSSRRESQRGIPNWKKVSLSLFISFSLIFLISFISALPSTNMPDPINISELILQRTLITQETDYNGDNITDVYTNFTKINSTLIEINVRQTNPNTKGGNAYKWASAICNKSSMTGLKYLPEDAQGGFANAVPINLNYGKLVNYGLPSTWCSSNGGNGYVLFGGGSGDKNYRLIIPQGKNFDIMTGKGSEQVLYEWLNNTFTIYPTDTYDRNPFEIKIYDCSGNQLTYPDIAWIEDNQTTDDKIIFYPHIEQVSMDCVRFRVNTLEQPHTCIETQFYRTCTPYYNLDFQDFEAKNNLTSRNISVYKISLWQSFLDTFPFVWRMFSYQADVNYYEIEYRGLITDFDPALSLVYSSGGDLPYTNQTEGTNLGARLQASVLSMDFNQNGENYLNLPYQNRSLYEQGTYIKDGSVYNNFGTSSGLTKQYWWNGNAYAGSNFIINGSLQFDGVNDYVVIPNGEATRPSGNFTVSTWINKKSSTGQIYSFTSNDAEIYISGDKLTGRTWSGSYRTVTGDTVLQNNTWYHAVMIFNGTNITLYLNGAFEKTGAGLITWEVPSANGQIGARWGGSTYFNGSIDDVIVWGRALNSSEISTIYSEGVAGRTVDMEFTNPDPRTIVNDGSRVAYYSFNTNESGNASDSWNSNNGTCTGTACPTWVNNSAFYTGGYNFDGSNDVITLPTGNVSTPYGNFTVSAWINSITGTGQILSFSSNDAELYVTGNKLTGQTWSGSYRTVTGTTTLQNNTWNHVVMIYNGTNVTLYLNGVLEKIGAGAITWESTAGARIGYRSGNTRPFNGKIDELMIFNKSLNSSEILGLYDSGKKQLHLQLDEVTGTTAYTTAGLSSGTLTNYPTTALTAPVYNATGGVSGSGAYEFDGVGGTTLDGKRITTSLISTKTEDYSFSVWVNPKDNNAQTQMILCNGNCGTNGWYLRWNSGRFNFMAATSTSVTGVLGTLNQWQHLVGVRASNGTNYLYLNGNITHIFTETTTTPTTSTTIGSYSTGAYGFNGSIDNVQIFNRALSALEVLELYNGTNANKTIKYSTKQGDFTSGVFYNSTQTYWNVTLTHSANSSGDIADVNGINLSNPNLVSYWALDGNYLDAKGRNNGTCTSTSCPNNASGLSSNAMRFDKSKPSFINGSISGVPVGNVTISMWINPSSLPSTTNEIINLDAVTGYIDYDLSLYKSGSNYLISADTIREGYAYSTTSLSTNQWYFVTVVFNQGGDKRNYVYINGQFEGNGSIRTSTMYAPTIFTLGASTSFASAFNGTIDEVLIYNTSLSASQVKQLYKSGLSQKANTNVTIQTRTANSYNVSDPSLQLLYTMQNPNIIIIPTNDTSKVWATGGYSVEATGEAYIGGSLGKLTCGGSNHLYFNFTAPTSGEWAFYANTVNGYNANPTYWSVQTDNGIQNSTKSEASNAYMWIQQGRYNFTAGNKYLIDANSTCSAAARRIAAIMFVKTGYYNSTANSTFEVDETGKNNGTWVGGVDKGLSLGVVDSGYSFEQAYRASYLKTNSLTILNGAKAVTYSGWFYFRDSGAASGGIQSGNPNRNGLNINSNVVAYINGNSITTSLPAQNRWHHIATTWSVTDNQSRIYINGVLITNGSTAASSLVVNTPTYIGVDSVSQTWVLDGFIDEVRIYNRSLSAEEVMNLYNLGSYHIEDWSAWTNQTIVEDGVPKVTSTDGKFMQFKTNLYSNTTDISPYVNSYNVTSAEPVMTDQAYPIFSNQQTNYPNGSAYVYGRNYEFNISVLNSNGSIGIEFNGANYTTTNISEVFSYYNDSLDASTYSFYYWGYGNGTLNLYNSSEIYSYTINKTILDAIIYGLGTFTYPKTTNVNYTESNQGDSDVVYNWFRNDEVISNPDTGILGVNTWTYILNSTGGLNYYENASIVSGDLVIEQNNSYVLDLTADPSWYGTIGDWITVTGIGCPNEITCNLYKNDVYKANPHINQYFNGTYLFVYNTTGNTNYSEMSTTDTLYINYTSPTTTTTTNQTLIYGKDAPYVILGFGTKFNNGGFVFKGHGIQFN